MKTTCTLFTQIEPYYTSLVEVLESAEQRISMMYLTFDHGLWAQKIGSILCAKALAGVQVRLMVDGIGEIADEPRHLFQNHAMLNHLRQAGVQVDIFHPSGHGLTPFNRLHCKFCGIDNQDVFIGGSNIGDYYLSWSDTNLHMQGALGNTFHDIYTYLHQFTQSVRQTGSPVLDPAALLAGDARVFLTIPGQYLGIRQSLLELIRNANQSIYLRTWYFLPDQEILQALQSKAEAGVRVRIMLSHHTRVSLVDMANYLPAHQLALSGVEIYRYAHQYMHAKLAWNDQGKVLLGSANLDSRSMQLNFESCVWLDNPALAHQLSTAFHQDLDHCIQQTPAVHPGRSFSEKFLSHACGLTSAWL